MRYTTWIHTYPIPICRYARGIGICRSCGIEWNADDSQGKAKYNKWKEVVDANMSQKAAEDKYVELGQQLLAKHGK